MASMIYKENKQLIRRLQNFKFKQAQKHLDGESEQVCEIVNALAETFENSGWIDGNIGVIINGCINSIIPNEEE